MKNERILSYNVSKKLNPSELDSVSVSGGTVVFSTEVTGSSQGGFDTHGVVTYDF